MAGKLGHVSLKLGQVGGKLGQVGDYGGAFGLPFAAQRSKKKPEELKRRLWRHPENINIPTCFYVFLEVRDTHGSSKWGSGGALGTTTKMRHCKFARRPQFWRPLDLAVVPT